MIESSSAPSSSGGVVGTIGTVTAAAGVIPGVGTAVSIAAGVFTSIANFFTGLVKGSTKHLDWGAANTKANVFASAMEALVKSVAVGKLDAIGENYRLRMISWIQGVKSARWGVGYPQNTEDIIHGLQTFPQGSDLRSKVFVTTWLWAIWTLQNVDLDSQDEWVDMAINDMNKVLLPSIKVVSGVDVPQFKKVGTQSAPEVGLGSGGQVTGVAVIPGKASIFSGFTTTDGIIVVVAIGLLWWWGKK